MEIVIPGRGSYRLRHLIADLNGTLAQDGSLRPGVAERLEKVAASLVVTVVTADTRGNARALAERLPVAVVTLKPGREAQQKLALVRRLGRKNTVSLGNGANDALMLKKALLGICVLGAEGAAGEAVRAADLVVTDINSALDLLLVPGRLSATLRK